MCVCLFFQKFILFSCLPQDVAAAINQGLIMDPVEKATRHANLYKVVTTHTSHTWAAVLVKMLLGQLGLQSMARQTPYIPKERLRELYVKAKKRLFLFDYDASHCHFWGHGIRLLIFISGNTLSDR